MDTVSFSKTTTAQVPQVRIGDAERQAAAHQLQQHFADGRLTWQELDERLAKAYAARINDDLTCLFNDLPMLAPPLPPPAPPRSRVQRAGDRLSNTDVRRVVTFAIVAAIAIAATRGVIIFPAVLVWWFVAGRHRGQRGSHGAHHGHHHRHGSGHGRAWS